MPNYIYRCRACNEEWEEFNTIEDRKKCDPCSTCGGRGEKLITGFSNLTFRPRWFEGISSQPVFVSSQSQLDGVCKESGCHVVKDDRGKQKSYYETRGMVAEGKRLSERRRA